MTKGVVRVLCAMALTTAACGDSSDQVDVFAASSLTDAFVELEAVFEADNPDVDVRLTFAGSNTLQRQIEDGAPADVFAPAGVALAESVTMPNRTGAELAAIRSSITVFAANTLTFVVPSDSTATDAAELLSDRDAVIARCAGGVPCGDATDTYVNANNIELHRATEEANVRDVLSKVRLGQADGGFVYRTDLLAAGGDVTELPLADPPSVLLPVMTLSTDDPHARAFVEFVRSDRAAEILEAQGFMRP